MNLEWHTRLIDRMIHNNLDATIKDYYRIVDKEIENEQIELPRMENFSKRYEEVRINKMKNGLIEGYDFSSNGKHKRQHS